MAEVLLTLLLISSVCAAGLAIVALEYLENVTARESSLMKYGICIQIWSFMVLCVLHFEFQNDDIFLHLMPMFTLIGAGIFMLGAISVAKSMPRAKATFAVLAAGIQACVVTFLGITAYLVP